MKLLKFLFFRAPIVAFTLFTLATPAPLQAAPCQIVVIVADGVGPQMVNLGRDYGRVAQGEPQLAGAFAALPTVKISATDSPAQLRELIADAEKNGLKTGLVTTGEITAEAAIFGSSADDFDFLAGGGHAALAPDTREKLRAARGTFLDSVAGLDNEIAGRVVAPQAERDLDFALDRNPSQQAGIGELTALALDTLGAGDASFVLIIHETLLQKSLETKDTPALFAEIQELDSLVASLEARRAENADLRFAVWLTGSAASPHFTSEDAAMQRAALAKIAGFSLSFAGAGRVLQGADETAIADFLDAQNGQYPGLMIAAPTIEKLVAGEVEPEKMVRDAAEPLLHFGFDGPADAPILYTRGFESPRGILDALRASIARK